MVHRVWGPGVVLAVDTRELLIVFDAVGYRHLPPATLTTGLLAVADTGGGDAAAMAPEDPAGATGRGHPAR